MSLIRLTFAGHVERVVIEYHTRGGVDLEPGVTPVVLEHGVLIGSLLLP